MFGLAKATRDAEFSAFVVAAQKPLVRMAYALTGDPSSARDLVQEALLKTYLAWGRIDTDNALAYTRRILVNQRIDTWRRTRKETATHTLPESAIDDASGTVDHRDQLVRLLATLPEQQRKVVVLRHYGDLSEADVADALGISIGSVKSACSRGLAALRSHASAATEGGPR